MLLTSLSAFFRRAFPVLLTLLAVAAGSAPLRASEAELKLPDLHTASFLGGSISGPALLMIGLGISALGFVFGIAMYSHLKICQCMHRCSKFPS